MGRPGSLKKSNNRRWGQSGGKRSWRTLVASVVFVFIPRWETTLNFWTEECDLSCTKGWQLYEGQGQKPRAQGGGYFSNLNDGGFNKSGGCENEKASGKYFEGGTEKVSWWLVCWVWEMSQGFGPSKWKWVLLMRRLWDREDYEQIWEREQDLTFRDVKLKILMEETQLVAVRYMILELGEWSKMET